MSKYIRAKNGNTFFFTVVTHARRPLLCLDPCRELLRRIINEVKAGYPFIIKAWVLLPEHMHCIWEMPEDDPNYSRRWGLIKKEFTKGVRELPEVMEMVGTAHPTRSRLRHREGVIWQRRFWEHRIRDNRDFRNHCDYIHFNPVKHGLVEEVSKWPWSTFHKFVAEEIYPSDWGGKIPVTLPADIGRE